MSQHGVHELFVTAHQNKLQPTVSEAIVIKYKEVFNIITLCNFS